MLQKCAMELSEIEDRLVEGVSDVGIRKTDELDGLECFCSDNPPTDNFEKSIRGCVFFGKKLVLKPLPYSTDIVVDDTFDSPIENISDFIVYDMRECTIIRLFFFSEKWYITTHRKLNAYKSKWGCAPSFGEIFESFILKKTNKSLQEFYNTLDKNLSYTFTIGTVANTRCVSPTHDSINLFVCQNENGDIVENDDMSDWYQKKLDFKDITSAKNYVLELSFPYTSCGLYLLNPKTLESFKFINNDYNKLTKLRNNIPSIPFAYVNCMFDPVKNLMFRKLYPEMETVFNEYDRDVQQIASNIYNDYVKRFLYKQNFIVPKYENAMLYSLHGMYIQNHERVTMSTVFDMLKTTNPSNINKMLGDIKKAKKLSKK